MFYAQFNCSYFIASIMGYCCCCLKNFSSLNSHFSLKLKKNLKILFAKIFQLEFIFRKEENNGKSREKMLALKKKKKKKSGACSLKHNPYN